MVHTFLQTCADECMPGPLATGTTNLRYYHYRQLSCHPNNTGAVSSRFNAPHDTELTGLRRFLTDLAQVDNVCGVRWRPIIRTIMKPRMAGYRITLAGCICTHQNFWELLTILSALKICTALLGFKRKPLCIRFAPAHDETLHRHSLYL